MEIYKSSIFPLHFLKQGGGEQKKKASKRTYNDYIETCVQTDHYSRPASSLLKSVKMYFEVYNIKVMKWIVKPSESVLVVTAAAAKFGDKYYDSTTRAYKSTTLLQIKLPRTVHFGGK